jgi:hypothetical protein
MVLLSVRTVTADEPVTLPTACSLPVGSSSNPGRDKNFLLRTPSRPVLRSKMPFPGVKRPELEAHYSPAN